MTVNINGDTGISQIQAGATVPDLNVDSGTLYVDPTNNRVGIGTASPADPLEISHATTSRIRFSETTNSLTLTVGQWGSKNRIESSGGSDLIISNYDASNPIAFYTGFGGQNTERMRIDANGRVTMPYQPAFSAKNLTYSGNGSTGTGGTVLVNTGSHYNSTNGRFTAPIAGTYLFFGSQQFYDSGSTTYVELDFTVNGTIVVTYPSGGAGVYNNHFCQTGTVIVSLSVGDYVTIVAGYGSRNGQNNFGGYLIG